MDNDRLHQLYDGYLDRALGAAEDAELAELISSHEGQRQWRMLASLEGKLQEDLQGTAAEKKKPTRRFEPRGPFRMTPGMAAGIAAAIALFILIFLPSSPPDRESATRRRRAEDKVRRAEEQLTVIRQKERELEKPAAAGPDAEQNRREEQARLKAERERIEREMAEAIKSARKPDVDIAKPAPPETPPAPPPATQVGRATVATLREVVGEVLLEKIQAVSGKPILEGQALDFGPEASAAVEYPDRTRLVLRGGRMEFNGKRVNMTQGTLAAHVSKQPAGVRMVFVTPQGEATVLGTMLRLVVDDTSTRLDVTEGRVRLKRLSDGKPVDVSAGFYAIAAAGRELAAKPLPIEEIVLRPPQGKGIGRDWQVAADKEAAAGKSWEVPHTRRWEETEAALKERPVGELVFTFTADAQTDYHLWIRGRCMAVQDRLFHDAVMVECPGASARALFSGWGNRIGYAWIGGKGDDDGDRLPVTIRFAKPGPQILKITAYETPIRIDTVWLSATQKTRPAEGEAGPTPR